MYPVFEIKTRLTHFKKPQRNDPVFTNFKVKSI